MTRTMLDMFTTSYLSKPRRSQQHARMEFTLIGEAADGASQPSSTLRRRTFTALQEADAGSTNHNLINRVAFRPALAVFACLLILCAVVAAFLSTSPQQAPAPTIAHAPNHVQPTIAPQMIIHFLSLVDQPIQTTELASWETETKALTQHVDDAGQFLIMRLPFTQSAQASEPSPQTKPFSARKYLPPVFHRSS